VRKGPLALCTTLLFSVLATGSGAFAVREGAEQAELGRGAIVGRLIRAASPPHGYKSTTRPVVGWTVLIARGKLSFSRTADIVATVKTGAGGRFAIHLKPGRYLLAGEFPPGEPNAGEACAPARVTVKPGARSHVLLGCSGA
jgi:hypothetical protein